MYIIYNEKSYNSGSLCISFVMQFPLMNSAKLIFILIANGILQKQHQQHVQNDSWNTFNLNSETLVAVYMVSNTLDANLFAQTKMIALCFWVQLALVYLSIHCDSLHKSWQNKICELHISSFYLFWSIPNRTDVRYQCGNSLRTPMLIAANKLQIVTLTQWRRWFKLGHMYRVACNHKASEHCLVQTPIPNPIWWQMLSMWFQNFQMIPTVHLHSRLALFTNSLEYSSIYNAIIFHSKAICSEFWGGYVCVRAFSCTIIDKFIGFSSGFLCGFSRNVINNLLDAKIYSLQTAAQLLNSPK